MPLIDVAPRLRELGRIRTGVTVEGTKDGKKYRRPEKLATFRLTTPSETLAKAVQAIYDGKVEPWESPAGPQFEVITKVDLLPIVIPHGEAMSQWYELWAAGGCQRRCDGRTEQLTDGPCLCPADPMERREKANARTPEACKPTTRLNVVLPDLPDLGVWRLESHGYYAAVELAGATQFLSMASSSGMNIPAQLRLEQREKKVPGKPTNRYAVPVIEFGIRIADLIAAGAGPMMLGDTDAPQLAAGALTPGKAAQPTRGPKVPRPALGPAPTVPDGSNFGRRQAVAPTAPPPALTSGVPEEPAEVAGWVVDGEAAPPETPQTPAEAEVAPTSAPSEEPAAEASDVHEGEIREVPGLTRDELIDGLREIGVRPSDAAKRGQSMFPGRADDAPLTDEQRAVLLATLTAEKAAIDEQAASAVAL